MKKYMILAAAAALTLAGCAKVETYKVSENNGAVPISFSNYTPKSVVRANDTYIADNALINGKQFAVYSWKTAYGTFLAAAPGTPDFMNPAVVTYANDTTTGENNTYSPVRYWPAGDEPENLSFTAYYPYGGAGITAPTFGTGVGVYAFTAQAASANMVDFCVADVVNDQVYGSTNASPTYKQTVKFTFKHQLTKVTFQFKKAAGLDACTVIELTDADLSGINNAGTLTATYAQNASPAVNAIGTTTTAWSAQSGAAAYQVMVNNVDPSATAVVMTETASTIHNNDIFLMVPQNMAADTQKLTIKWNVKVYDTAANAAANGTTGLISTTPNTKELSLFSNLVTSDTDDTAVAAINWAKNAQVNYTITIGPKPIWFTADVASWDAIQNGYFNVQ